MNKPILTIAALSLLILTAFTLPTKDSRSGEKSVPVKSLQQEQAQIQWLSLEEADKQMKESPKKLYVDVYTDWCGWCKVQDRKTFAHPEIIKLMNKYFYAVKFDAESRDSLKFNGKKYGFMPKMGRKGLNSWAHRFARKNGRLGYPTSLFFSPEFQRLDVLSTYLDPSQMEKILTYYGEDYPAKGISWAQFVASFQGKIPPSQG